MNSKAAVSRAGVSRLADLVIGKSPLPIFLDVYGSAIAPQVALEPPSSIRVSGRSSIAAWFPELTTDLRRLAQNSLLYSDTFLGMAEMALPVLLFSDSPIGEKFRHSGLYADYFSDDN